VWTWWNLRKLQSPDPNSRKLGVRRLAGFSAPSTVLQSLFGLHSDPDQWVRYSLAYKIDVLKWPAFPTGIQCMLALLFDEYSGTREKALNALNIELSARKLLREELHKLRQVYQPYATSEMQVEDVEDTCWEVQFLRQCLLTGDKSNRSFFIGWLFDFGATTTTDEEVEYYVGRGDWSEAAKRGSWAVRPLLETDKSDEVRYAIVHAITENDSPEVRRAATEFFSDATQKVKCRVRAANVLEELRVREAVPALQLALRSSDEWLRRNAASALGKIGDPASAGDLIRLALTTQPGPRIEGGGPRTGSCSERMLKPFGAKPSLR